MYERIMYERLVPEARLCARDTVVTSPLNRTTFNGSFMLPVQLERREDIT